MITGKDDRSLLVLEDLQDGVSVSAAAAKHALSLDQVKRLSRYRSILQAAKEHLSQSALDAVKAQGLKVLYIADLFKKCDWLGLEEILATCDQNTTRDDLKRLVQALAEKRERVQAFQDEAERSIARLEEQSKQLAAKEDECQRLKSQIEASLSEFDRYGPDIKAFIIEHVGIIAEQYCLKKRVDSLWFQDLKKKKLAIYDDSQYLYLIPDLDQFIEAYRHRLKHRGNVLWDEDREYERWEKKMDSGFTTYYEFPNSPYYKNGQALITESLTTQLKKMEQQLQEIRKEQEKIKRTISKKKKSSVKSFMEAVEARNTLSASDLRTHGELQQKAMRWLFDQGFIVISELVLENGRRVDVIGYNKESRIVIIEVKASRSDLLGDEKWISYLDACDEFYFCTLPYLADWSYEKQELKGKTDAGLLLPAKRGESLEIAITSCAFAWATPSILNT
ncbi:DNA repair protein MmcB-related protein (plasmid) [Brevibacillus laterosporus]|uniref:DNA repair protein MmcB-related protein n=1 Tax=Brevibacillus laterosporus TaxID=1465 RepID=A0A518V1W7_BRELA|nr:DNA repair protein MmcB-related protein [Brevibacillus laterosporus]